MSQHSRTAVLKTREIEYIIRKRRGQRQLALSIHSDGRVTLTIPAWSTLKTADKFVQEKSTWLEKTLQKIQPSALPSKKHQREHYLAHKEKARTLILERLHQLNQRYGFSYKRVAIRSNTSRWGSCSEQGNLNFDYRVVFLPDHLCDYILVHELCHLREMNHSPRFWALVAETVPSHRAHRRSLKKIDFSSLYTQSIN